jgi:hypothetical protein
MSLQELRPSTISSTDVFYYHRDNREGEEKQKMREIYLIKSKRSFHTSSHLNAKATIRHADTSIARVYQRPITIPSSRHTLPRPYKCTNKAISSSVNPSLPNRSPKIPYSQRLSKPWLNTCKLCKLCSYPLQVSLNCMSKAPTTANSGGPPPSEVPNQPLLSTTSQPPFCPQ